MAVHPKLGSCELRVDSCFRAHSFATVALIVRAGHDIALRTMRHCKRFANRRITLKMVAIFNDRTEVPVRAGWCFRLMSLVSLCCFMAIVLLPLSSVAQGGPPLLTDDPGTPGRNNWEINLGYTMDRQPQDNYYETPILDMNYGWGDRVQLKYEMPYVYNSAGKGPLASGPGDSKFGVKIRFFQDEKLDLNISTYPQLEINNTSNSARRGLVFNGPLFLLPLEVTKKVGPVDVDLEVGHWFTQQKGYWISGLAFGHQATRRLEVLGEVYSNGTPVRRTRQHLRLWRSLPIKPARTVPLHGRTQL